MLITVIKKPTPFCSTSALPSHWGGAFCEDMAENCGESATTTTPQNSKATSCTSGQRSGIKGKSRHIAPEAAKALAATRALPTRRLQTPPSTQPKKPMPMTAKLIQATVLVKPWPGTAQARAIGRLSQGNTLQKA
jgi:hypothetical protein